MSRSQINSARDAVIDAARDVITALAGWDNDLAGARRRLEQAIEHLDAIPLTTRATHGAFPAGASDTTREAARLAVPLQNSARKRIIERVYGQMHVHGVGCTDDELERRLHLSHQTLSAARNFLCEAGWLEDSGQRRPTRGKRDAIVWRLTEGAMNQLREEAIHGS